MIRTCFSCAVAVGGFISIKNFIDCTFPDIFHLLDYLAMIRNIRDTDPSLFDHVKRLPRKSKTGRRSQKVKDNATLTFIRKGALKEFFITDKTSTEQIPFIEAVKYLECKPDEEKISVDAVYYEHLKANSEKFDESILQADDETIVAGNAHLRGNDSKVVRALRALQTSLRTLTDDQETELNQMIQAYMNGNIPQNITKDIAKEIKEFHGDDPTDLFYIIRRSIPDAYLHDQRDAVLNIEGEKQVILSCYLEKSNG